MDSRGPRGRRVDNSNAIPIRCDMATLCVVGGHLSSLCDQRKVHKEAHLHADAFFGLWTNHS